MSNEITLPEAVAMTHAYQNDPLFAGQTVAAKINNASYLEIINQPGCVEVRTYFAKDAAGALTLVAVGVDGNGNDMTSGKIMDGFKRCPFDCPQNSPLM
jgi:hypothetical protein